MKRFIPKFSVLTILYVSVCFYFKWYKETLLLMGILLVHEYCHFLTALYYKYDIKEIVVYPFGAFLKLNDYGFHRMKEDILVASAGLCSHLLLLGLYPFIKEVLGGHMAHYYIQYNIIILCFNALPIYPLDGFKVLQCLLSMRIDYLKSIKISIYISWVSLVMVILCSFQWCCLGVYLFLVSVNYDYLNHYYLDYLRYLFLRNEASYYKPCIHHKKKFYRTKNNFYKVKNQIIDEKTAIKSGFIIDNKSLWW